MPNAPETDLHNVLMVLNATCGDMLKAQVLNSVLGVKLELGRIHNRPMTADEAFAAAKRKMLDEPEKDDTPAREHRLPSAVRVTPRVDDARRWEAKMGGKKFDTVEPVAAAKAGALPSEPTLEPDKTDDATDGPPPATETSPPATANDVPATNGANDAWIDLKTVADVLGVGYARAFQLVGKEQWETKREGRKVLVNKKDVLVTKASRT